MNSRQRTVQSSKDLPTHVLVRFREDDCLSIVPIKNVVKPTDVPLKQGTDCTVKWSTGELFACTVIGAGNKKAMEVAEAKEIKRLEQPVEKNSVVPTVTVKTKKRGQRKRKQSDEEKPVKKKKKESEFCIRTLGSPVTNEKQPAIEQKKTTPGQETSALDKEGAVTDQTEASNQERTTSEESLSSDLSIISSDSSSIVVDNIVKKVITLTQESDNSVSKTREIPSPTHFLLKKCCCEEKLDELVGGLQAVNATLAELKRMLESATRKKDEFGVQNYSTPVHCSTPRTSHNGSPSDSFWCNISPYSPLHQSVSSPVHYQSRHHAHNESHIYSPGESHRTSSPGHNRSHRTSSPPGRNISHRTSSPGRYGSHRTSSPGRIGSHRTSSPGRIGSHRNSSPGRNISHRTSSPGRNGSHRTSSPGRIGSHRTSSPGRIGSHRTSSPGRIGSHRTSSPGRNGSHRTSSAVRNESHRTFSPGRNGSHRTSSAVRNESHRTSSPGHNGSHRTSSPGRNKSHRTYSNDHRDSRHISSPGRNELDRVLSHNRSESHRVSSHVSHQNHVRCSSPCHNDSYQHRIYSPHRQHSSSRAPQSSRSNGNSPKKTTTSPSKKVPASCFSAAFLMGVKRKSCSRNNFATNMVRELYSLEERRVSNVRGVKGKNQLDPEKLSLVKEVTFQMYPCDVGEKEHLAWRMCCKAIDESCRRFNKEREKVRKENIPPQ